MFRAIASLMLFGALTPVSTPSTLSSTVSVPEVAAPAPNVHVDVGEQFSASGAIVVDVLSGTELFALDAETVRSMASLAKLMTAIVILENHDLRDVVTVPRSVLSIRGNTAGLLPGERYSVQDLMEAMLIASANDAAHTFAVYHSGSEARFAEEMTERATILGLKRTQFSNATGFDSPYQYSTPRDLAWLSLYALKNDFIRSVTSRKATVIVDRITDRETQLFTTNRLLSSHPKRFQGLKTGTTRGAGECLISLAYHNDRPYLFIVLHSSDRYSDTLQLFHSLSQKNV